MFLIKFKIKVDVKGEYPVQDYLNYIELYWEYFLRH